MSDPNEHSGTVVVVTDKVEDKAADKDAETDFPHSVYRWLS